MVATGAAQSLSIFLSAEAPVPPARAVEFVGKLAAQLEPWHDQGRIHGAVMPSTMTVDASGQPVLPAPEPSVHLGLEPDTALWLPPRLRAVVPLQLPKAVDQAERVFQELGIALAPRQIDLYALGELLCRLLTGESADAYSRSARLKGRIPVPFWPVLERALGINAQEQFVDAGQFRQALESASQTLHDVPVVQDEAAVDADAAEHAAGLKSDTKPSFLSTEDRPADTSVGRKPAAASRDAEDGIPFARLGHYEVVGRIGRGGMGDVYLGYERALDRKVAIKVLPAELSRHADFVRRFQAEATAAARLIHPNIIQIHFIGEDAGHHFFAMQYVEGESLADLLSRSKKLEIDEGLAILEQALSGLAAAHKQGLVHRDIKPGNILLDRANRRALLADFGLVKSLGGSETGHTATGVVMGTVDYISPEQGRGQAVDGRSDLYSMGVLCYRMLSGRLPFVGDSPTSLIFQHAHEQAPSLLQLAPQVPAPVRTIIERMMAKSPAVRHQSADEVLADLRAFRSGLPLPGEVARAANHEDSTSTRQDEDVETQRRQDAKQRKEPSLSRPRGTTIIRLSAIDDVPPLPERFVEAGRVRWWEQAKDRAFSLFRRHAPEVLKRLENTQQQVDGAVAEYRHRQQKLQQVADEAEAVLAELRSESQERPSAGLQSQIADQEEQLGLIHVRLAQANAVLRQLASQRDLLHARLQMAQARTNARPEPGQFKRRLWDASRSKPAG